MAVDGYRELAEIDPGDGMPTVVLCECKVCAAVVADLLAHTAWHTRSDRVT